MTILSFQIDSVGQSGVVPKMIQINTNNTVSQLLQTGFLNGLVSQGISLSETDIALVSTTPTPEATSSQVAFFNIVQSGSNWSLTQYNTFSPANPYTWTGSQTFEGGFLIDNESTINLLTTTSMALSAGTDFTVTAEAITLEALDGELVLAATTSVNIVNGIGTLTGQVAAPTHTPPAGYNYLIINAAGLISQFAA